MARSPLDIAESFQRFARNPLGIIALFITLVYLFATVLLGWSASDLSDSERRIMIWFVVLFPLVILAAFYFLVTKHHWKLYAPGDYKKDASFLEALTPSERREKLEEELAEAEEDESSASEDAEAPTLTDAHPVAVPSPTEGASVPRERQQRIKEMRERRLKYEAAEERMLQELERQYNSPFDRNVRFGERNLTAFDGVAFVGNRILLAEVKLVKSSKTTQMLFRDTLIRAMAARDLVRSKTLPQDIPSRKFELILAVVYDGPSDSEYDRLQDRLTSLADEVPFNVSLRFARFDDLVDEEDSTSHKASKEGSGPAAI